jgi:hypothetical protein
MNKTLTRLLLAGHNLRPNFRKFEEVLKQVYNSFARLKASE